MNNLLTELRTKPHWSFSSLNGLLNICSLQWAFKYIYNLEPELTSVSLLFGSAFHKAASWIAILRQQGIYENPQEAQEVFSEAWKIECKAANNFKISAEEFNILDALGRKMIDCLSRKWTEDNIVAVGKVFSIKVASSEKPLIGEYDLLVKNDLGTNVIIDWKTAEKKWPESKANKDLQATVFCYAYRKTYNQDCLFRYDVITKTKDPQYIQYPAYRFNNDFKRLEKLIALAERAVQSEIFFPNDQSFYCSGCQYASACKAWHKTQSKTISLPIAV